MSWLTDRLAAQIDDELSTRRRPMPTVDIGALTFPIQRRFVEDPSDFAVACCSRRAGKSTAGRRLLIHTGCSQPASLSVYVALTRQSAKRLMWEPLKQDLWALGIAFESNETELTLTLPGNGSRIWLAGANDAAQIERLRGHAFDLAMLDEAQSMRERILEPLVQDVITPALLDRRGKMRLLGTPGPIPDGYFYRACHSEDWSRHHWTLLDNPNLRDPASFLEMIRSKHGLTEAAPTYRREYLGEWVMDRDILVLSAFDPAASVWSELPGGAWTYVLGVDVGYHDSDAIVVLGWSSASPGLYLVDEYVRSHQTEEQLSIVLRSMIDRFAPMSVVGDTGGGGRKTIEGISSRLGYPIKAAHKPSVVEQFARLNDEFRAKRLLLKSGSVAAHDAIRLRWELGKVGRRVDDAFHSDALPALSYAYAEARHYYYAEPKPRQTPRTRLEKELERW